MKFKGTILVLLFIQCFTTSFQCSKCHMNNMYLDNSKSWFPLRGTKQLAFVDDSGNVTNFAIRGLDTTVVNTTECGDTYNYQYITNTLYLNTTKTDSIYFNLFNKANLEGRGVSDNTYNFSMWDVLGKAKEGKQAKRLSRFRVGNKTYNDVIMIFHGDYSPDTIDSVMVANNVGIVGFKSHGIRYALQ